MPDVSGASAVNTRVHTKTTKRTRGCGCIGHPAFPAPSDDQKAQLFRKTRTHRAARWGRCVFSSSLKIESGTLRTLYPHPRRPGESQDPYAVAHVWSDAGQRLSCNNLGLGLWVLAFARTTPFVLLHNPYRWAKAHLRFCPPHLFRPPGNAAHSQSTQDSSAVLFNLPMAAAAQKSS